MTPPASIFVETRDGDSVRWVRRPGVVLVHFVLVGLFGLLFLAGGIAGASALSGPDGPGWPALFPAGLLGVPGAILVFEAVRVFATRRRPLSVTPGGPVRSGKRDVVNAGDVVLVEVARKPVNKNVPNAPELSEVVLVRGDGRRVGLPWPHFAHMVTNADADALAAELAESLGVEVDEGSAPPERDKWFRQAFGACLLALIAFPHLVIGLWFAVLQPLWMPALYTGVDGRVVGYVDADGRVVGEEDETKKYAVAGFEAGGRPFTALSKVGEVRRKPVGRTVRAYYEADDPRRAYVCDWYVEDRWGMLLFVVSGSAGIFAITRIVGLGWRVWLAVVAATAILALAAFPFAWFRV